MLECLPDCRYVLEWLRLVLMLSLVVFISETKKHVRSHLTFAYLILTQALLYSLLALCHISYGHIEPPVRKELSHSCMLLPFFKLLGLSDVRWSVFIESNNVLFCHGWFAIDYQWGLGFRV